MSVPLIAKLLLCANIVQSIAVLIFFVPYVIFQPPMTIIIRKLGPTYFLGGIIVSWGAIMIVGCPSISPYGSDVSRAWDSRKTGKT